MNRGEISGTWLKIRFEVEKDIVQVVKFISCRVLYKYSKHKIESP